MKSVHVFSDGLIFVMFYSHQAHRGFGNSPATVEVSQKFSGQLIERMDGFSRETVPPGLGGSFQGGGEDLALFPSPLPPFVGSNP